MNRLFLFILILAFPTAVSANKAVGGAVGLSGYPGQLNSLITLQPDTTWVWISDFTPSMAALDSITWSSGLGMKVSKPFWKNEGKTSAINIKKISDLGLGGLDSVQVWTADKWVNKIQWIKLWSHGEYSLIPVRVSEKKTWEFMLLANENQYKKVQVKGSFTAWRAVDLDFSIGNTEYKNPEDGKIENLSIPGWRKSMWVGPGSHQYVFIVDGKEIRDPLNSDSISNGMGGWNSVFVISTQEYFMVANSFSSGSVVEPAATAKKPALELRVHDRCFVFGKKKNKKVRVSTTNVDPWIDLVLSAPAAMPVSEVESASQKNPLAQKTMGKSFQIGDATYSVLALWNNQEISGVEVLQEVNDNRWKIRVRLDSDLVTRFGSLQSSFIRVWMGSTLGISNDVMIPMKGIKPVLSPDELDANDPRKKIIYNPMIDRFVNGNVSNDKPLLRSDVDYKVDFYGGDIAGIIKKIEEGYFNTLGINTLWISPVVKNPAGPYGQWKKPSTKFSAYHGYWPVALRETDERFCTPDELKKFIRVAHAHGISVLLDYVAHHVHEEHPLYKQKPSWFTPLILPDGSKNTERWDDYRLTTWFDDFMPTFNYFKPEVVDALTDSALWWFKEFEVDGFRHDATKHIPDAFWRTLNYKVKRDIQLPSAVAGHSRSLYQIGETYGSSELISSYLGSGLLDAQFDFNMYDAMIGAFKGNGGMRQLGTTLNDSRKWYGAHHSMGNITGNQDKPRTISLLDGSVKDGEDTKQAGWDRNIKVNDEKGAYTRMESLFAFNFSIPGIPVIYYGDEIGMPGANDPDSRRMMRFETGYQGSVGDVSSSELSLRSKVSRMAKLRSESMSLLYGELETHSMGDSVLVISRKYFGETVWTVINNSNSLIEVKISPENGKAEIVSISSEITANTSDSKKNTVAVGWYQAKLKQGNIYALNGGLVAVEKNESAVQVRISKKSYEILKLSSL